MENKNFAAFPFLETENHNSEFGLTKREYFAARAMQGILSGNNYYPHIKNMWGTRSSMAAKAAVIMADELLKELEKPANSLKEKIESLHKGESNDLMDKGWNEAIEHITKNIL